MNLLERIEQWAAVRPGGIAHISGDRHLSFQELSSASNCVAAYLQERCGKERAPIAVLGHREAEMLIAFIGVVKSGRPYIPIDTSLPKERIKHILKIARPALVLTPPETATIWRFGRKSADKDRYQVRREDPFYIIFTSGSSGEPKGIVITLRSLEHFLQWMLSEQNFAEQGEVFLNQAPFSFDLSVLDLYCSLATGGTLFSISRDLVANPKLLYRALACSNITIWVSTPSFVELCLCERKFGQTLLPRVRRFLFCGEILSPQTAGVLLDRFPDVDIWNFYGPTEATVAATSVRIDHDVLKKYPSLPVGRPMPGSKVFVVDENRRPLPEGARGEIVIQGANVSSGYLGRPDLTAGTFFEENGQRGYRTGDRGQFHDGLLFFEGRIDRQIKLGGYRIELDDIESNLRALSIVRDAAVLPVSNNGRTQWLAGFVVPNSPNQTSIAELTTALRERLALRLPLYMIPRKFVVLNRFPITANGKIDRQKLAESL